MFNISIHHFQKLQHNQIFLQKKQPQHDTTTVLLFYEKSKL